MSVAASPPRVSQLQTELQSHTEAAKNQSSTFLSSDMCELTEKFMREVFDKADADGNGAVSVNELVTLVRKTGKPITRKGAEELIKQFDKDKNGTLEFSEFVAMMNFYFRDACPDHSDERNLIFEVFDQNKDGLICKEELGFVLNQILDERMSERDIDDFMREADTNKDGFIDFNEFSKGAAKRNIYSCK